MEGNTRRLDLPGEREKNQCCGSAMRVAWGKALIVGDNVLSLVSSR